MTITKTAAEKSMASGTSCAGSAVGRSAGDVAGDGVEVAREGMGGLAGLPRWVPWAGHSSMLWSSRRQSTVTTMRERLTGLFSLLEENLAAPFTTEVLGVALTVRRVDLIHEEIVAVCRRGRVQQAIGIFDLPLPDPPPHRVQWVEAYRHWVS